MTNNVDLKISQLPTASALAGTELIEVVQGGDNKRATPAAIKTYIGDAAPTGVGQNDGLMTHEDKALLDSAIQPGDVDDTPVDGATNAPISSNWAYDHAADDSAHGNVPAPILTGPALSIQAGVALELTIADYDSYASYSVAAGTGSASMDGDTITYTGAVTGSDTLTITVNDHSRVLTITVLANNLIDAPDPAPAIGAALEGGYYTGAIWIRSVPPVAS